MFEISQTTNQEVVESDLVRDTGAMVEKMGATLYLPSILKGKDKLDGSATSKLLSLMGVKNLDIKGLNSQIQNSKAKEVFQKVRSNIDKKLEEIASQTGLDLNVLKTNPEIALNYLLGTKYRKETLAAAIIAPVLLVELAHKFGNPGVSSGNETTTAFLLATVFGTLKSTTNEYDQKKQKQNIKNPPEGGKKVSEKTRNLIKLLGCLGLITFCATGAIITGGIAYSVGGQAEKVKLAEPTPTVMPESVLSDQVDKTTATNVQKAYQEGELGFPIDPLNVDIYSVRRQAAYFGWDWWYINADPAKMDKIFSHKFSKDQLTALKLSPDSFFDTLTSMKTGAKTKLEKDQIQKVIDFYSKRKGFNGTPQDFLNLPDFGTMKGPNDEEIRMAKSAIDDLVVHGKKEYGRTGLSKQMVRTRMYDRNYKI